MGYPSTFSELSQILALCNLFVSDDDIFVDLDVNTRSLLIVGLVEIVNSVMNT